MDSFALAHATGTDWKSITKKCLADLNGLEERPGFENLGLIYLTDSLAGDADNILTLLRNETGIADWVGSVGMGICATGHEYFNQPALAVLVAELPEDSFRLLELQDSPDVLPPALAGWAQSRESRFAVVHADPRNGKIPEIIAALADQLNGFLVGGLTSSRGELSQVSGGVCDGGVSGVLLAADVPVVTALSQSCMPIASRHQITACEENVLIELDGRPALEVFKEDIGDLLARDLQRVTGYIFAALPIAHSDTGDYLVRNLTGIDVERQLLAIGERVETGQSIQFCRRDAEAAETDLVRMLSDLRKRTVTPPKGALYFTCLARGPNMFGDASQELKIIERELGDVPLVGFFCNGEISHRRLYTYTGVLTLFT
ncbi:MAG: FIST N-terminal domain-containing protein [Alphaproteobacteria bacterium]